MELCGGKRKVVGIVWWEEKGRWNCVMGKRKVGGIVWMCGGKRKVGGIVWWEEKGRWNCVVGRERYVELCDCVVGRYR